MYKRQVLGCYRRAQRRAPAALRWWAATGQAKVCVKVPAEAELLELRARLAAAQADAAAGGGEETSEESAAPPARHGSAACSFARRRRSSSWTMKRPRVGGRRPLSFSRLAIATGSPSRSVRASGEELNCKCKCDFERERRGVHRANASASARELSSDKCTRARAFILG